MAVWLIAGLTYKIPLFTLRAVPLSLWDRVSRGARRHGRESAGWGTGDRRLARAAPGGSRFYFRDGVEV